jgi:S1-C subfamily serine protease
MKSRRSLLSLFLSLFCFLFLGSSQVHGEDLGRTLSKLHKDCEGTVVPVEFTARVTIEGLPGINSKDNERNLRGTACGVVVAKGKRQYVIVPTTSLTPGAQVFEILGATARIRWVRFLVDTGGGVKVGATVVNSSHALGLSLLRLDKSSDVLKAAALSGDAKTALGDRVVLVHTSTRLIGSPRLVTLSRIAGTTDKPRPLTLLSPAAPRANGALSFLVKDGKASIIGIHAALVLSSLPATKSSVGQRAFEAEEVETAARGYLFPASEIAKWVKNSKEKKINRPKNAAAQAWLGVEVQVITEELATALGLDYDGVAKIKAVYPGSPAAKAGLKADDVVIELDEESLEMAESESMRDLVRDLGVGTEISLTILRAGKKIKLKAQLENSPPSPETAARFPCHAHGFVFRDRTFFDKEAVAAKKGLVVSKISAKGNALLAGLKVNDIIVEINGQKVDKVEQARTLVQASQSLLVKIWRKGAEKALTLRIQVN